MENEQLTTHYPLLIISYSLLLTFLIVSAGFAMMHGG